MLAAGSVGSGRVVILADSDALGYGFTSGASIPDRYRDLDRADNWQLAISKFEFLAVPEPTTAVLDGLALLAAVCWRMLPVNDGRNKLRLVDWGVSGKLT